MSDENIWCRHVSLDLQEIVHGWGLYQHHALLPPIIQGHMVNCSQASGRGENDEKLGTKQLFIIIKTIGAGTYHWTSRTYEKLCMDWAFIHIMLYYSQQSRGIWSIADKHLEEKRMMRVWEQNNYLKSSIPWFQAGVNLGAASWLVTKLESCGESARSENRTPLIVGSISIDMPFTNIVDCNSSMLQAGVEPIILTKNILLPTRRVPSFVGALLFYAHGCTFLALLSMPSPNPFAWHIMRRYVWCLDGDGSRSSHLFFIIEATCNSGACFGWDTQACNQAIGTRAVTSIWVSKYASDLERSFPSTSTKSRGTTSNIFLPYSLDQTAELGSGMHMSNIFEAIQLLKGLVSCFNWEQVLVHKRIPLILYFFLRCHQINLA